MIIAIDGTSGSGKSTVAKLLSEKTGFELLNTGLIYRKITKYCLNRNISYKEIDKINNILNQICFTNINNEMLHLEEISEYVPLYARYETVREFVRKIQRSFAEGKNIIVEGRDIGTIVFPNADRKIYIDASIEERTKRRMYQLKVDGILIYDEIKKNLEQRDNHDKDRAISPLKIASDEIIIDTTSKTLEEVMKEIEENIA